jgi:glycerol-3-phosphate dehydrogenase (NAD(P)+)
LSPYSGIIIAVTQKLCVAGAGNWGTVLAWLLAARGHKVHLLCRDSALAEQINRAGRNPQYQPALELGPGVQAGCDWAEGLYGADALYLAVPGLYLRGAVEAGLPALRDWAGRTPHAVLCACTKGLLVDPVERIDTWLATQLPGCSLVH